MSWSFTDSLIFAAVMTLRDMDRDKQRQLIKTQKYYQQCYEKIADESSHACNLIFAIVSKASPVYTPKDISDGVQYLALYCFGKVIRKQGKVTKEQNKVMGFYFNNFDFPFSQSQYVNAMIGGSNIKNFNDLMELSRIRAGAFWVNLFRAFYKSGTQKDFQDIVDSVTDTIMRFAILGDPNSSIAIDICTEFVENANYQIQHVMDIEVKDIDWLGIVPISERKEEMRNIYYSLIEDTDITEAVDEYELKQLFDLLFLNSICDIVMSTKKPNSVKMEMINDSIQFVDIEPFISPEQYVKEIANNSGAGSAYHEMFSCSSGPGQFWDIILIMGAKANRGDDPVRFLNDLISILIQVEQHLTDKYQFLGTDQIVRQYSAQIVSSIVAAINS